MNIIKLLIKQKTMVCIVIAAVLVFVFAVKIAVKVYAKTEGEKLTVIMYHSVLKDESQHGEYVISPVELEKDLKYLNDNGYTTVTSGELIDFVYSKKPLPDKPVMLTFDDGSLNNYTYVLPLLEKYNMKAVFSVVGSFCDREQTQTRRSDAYSYINWDEVKALYQSGKVDIACHSYNFHSLSERKGAAIKDGESYKEYRSAFLSDTNKFLNEAEEKAGAVPDIYAYPYGFMSEESKNLVKTCGFKISLICEERVNTVTSDPSSLYGLGRFNRSGSVTTEEFMKKVGL